MSTIITNLPIYDITKVYPILQMDAYIHSPVLTQDYLSDHEFICKIVIWHPLSKFLKFMRKCLNHFVEVVDKILFFWYAHFMLSYNFFNSW